MSAIPTPEERPWLTVAELAEITGEGQKAIRAGIAAGTLPSLRVGRYVRIPTARLRQVLGIDPRSTYPTDSLGRPIEDGVNGWVNDA